MVSILIVHYNTFDLTFACVASCYAHLQKEAFEVLLVNNGSEEKPLTELIAAFPDVQLIESGGNIGFAKGNNLGIAAAKGEFILLLNSDCELTSDVLTPLVQVLQQKSDVGVLTCQLRYADGVQQNNYQSFPSISGDVLEFTRLFKLMNREKYATRYENRLLDPNSNHYCDWVWGAFFLFRKADLMAFEHQQLSDRFFMYGEDMEWCWQFLQSEKRSYYCAEIAVVHHMGKSNFGTNTKKWDTIIGNEIRTIRQFKGRFYTFFFRFFRAVKYALSFQKPKENWYFVKRYLFLNVR